MSWNNLIPMAFGVLCVCFWQLPALAEVGDRCPRPVAKIVSAQGTIELKEAAAEVWRQGKLNALVCPGDSIRVGERSRGAIVLLDTDAVLRIDQNTELRVPEPPQEDRSLLSLLRGVIHFFSRSPQSLEVQTPFVNAAVEGTEFLIRVAQDRAFVTVFEGRVAARNESGSLSLTSNQSAVVHAGEAPQRRIVVRPRDAVLWALYYPPVLTCPAQDLPPALCQAGRLLAVGRVDEARSILDKVPDAPPAGSAKYALLTVIAVARNERVQALENGKRAVVSDSRSSAARIALSYALQANFELEAARDTLLVAVGQQPKDGLAWARLAELWLSLGYLGEALEAAETAASLAPDLGRTNAILGFAALTQIKVSEAKVAFERAIELESTDPLPRLGLGLAKIRDGDLSEGRRDIEIAASLDPNNALVRSYLGKAYFGEKRSPLAVDQFALARELDPADPTPWFYDAIRKQTENDPIGALGDLQRSIEKNDNRAVYRSRLLLDEDQAMRGASLARVYDDLGFDQLALVESMNSLAVDPANHSAHRFLSDSYAARPRHEIARASELLQAQLLQPININPVQPRLAETDLNILAGAGPAEAAFNEFTPLFDRDLLQLVVSGVAGNNDTLSDEAVLSGVAGRVSFSLGQFHYESDGFRANNDIQHDIYNVFGQVALTDQLDIQFEYRRRDTDQGDLRLNFDPDDFSTFDRRRIESDIPRVGLHYAPSPRSDFIASLIYTDRTEEVDKLDAGVIIDADLETKGYDGQAQYLFRGDRFNITAGLGASHIDLDGRNGLDFSGVLPFPCPPGPPFFGICEFVTESTIEQYNTYLYANVAWPADMTWTFGLSYGSLEQDLLEVYRFNPKAGLQWNFTQNARLRLAYMKSVKRTLIVDQTLEPTQVAGFNQFFDDINGTKAERYGIGIDAKLTKDLYGGLEASRRDLEVPRILLDPLFEPLSVLTEDQREELYRAYLYWTPDPEWAVSVEFRFERFERKDPPGLPAPLDIPTEVDTASVPLAVRYFRTAGLGAGFFAQLGATYVHQDVDLPPASTFGRDQDDFVLVDAAVGYRLPRRMGLLSLEVRNLLDEEFLFQDVNIQRPEPSNPRFIPGRAILGRITLSF